MSASALLYAQQITESHLRIAFYSRARLTDEDRTLIEEAIRRLKQHEKLVEEVLRDLRRKVAR